MRAERLVLESIADRCLGGDDGSDCFREGNAYRVRLWGTLPDGWAGNFALHACALGIEIASGDAICLCGGRWAATFVVCTTDPRASVARHDFLLMARRAPRVVPPLPAPCVQIAIEEAVDGVSDVTARVTGKNAIGLLADVLRRFDALALRPREFSIRTIDGGVDDWFWLERTSLQNERLVSATKPTAPATIRVAN
jgi:hypothetical protein